MLKSGVNYIRHLVIESNKLELFILLSLLYLLSAILINEYVLNDELYYRSLGSQLSLPVIDELIRFRNKWQWISYLGIPVILAIKFLIVSTFLSMGAIVAGHKLTFRQIFAMAMVAESVYLSANLITTGNILLSDIKSLEDLNLSLFSLASLVSESNIEQYFYVPLQSISIFLIIYILYLSYCYRIITGFPFRQSLILILSTYGTAFVMWTILIMYLLISYA